MKGYKKNRLSRYVLAALTVGMFSMVPMAYALPVQDTTHTNTAGSAINTSVANQMGITSTVANNVMNWKTFSIANGEKVQFDTNNYLNLVRGASKSEIDGNLSGGGNIYLINPNGILFGKNATVNVGNLVASTRAITDADQTTFLAGNNPITTNAAGSAAGDIINLGKLQTTSLVLEGNNITIQNAADITSNGSTALTDKVAIKADGLITVGHSLGNNTVKRKFVTDGTEQNAIYWNVHNYANDTYTSSGYTATDLAGAKKSVTECMLVEDVYDLQNMDAKLDGNYMLAKDINASGTSSWNYYLDVKLGINYCTGFSPVGSYDNNFIGTFDGANHTISNFYINDITGRSIGLFGDVSKATIQNVGIDSNISKTGASGYGTGSVVGAATDSIIRNVYNTGTVSGYAAVGGVVGYATNSTITNAYNTGTVSGSKGKFNNDSNDGCYIGGVVGESYGSTITSAYNMGTVSGISDVGGVVGGSIDSGNTVTNAYNTGAVSGTGSYVGGVQGEASGSTISNVYNTGAVAGISEGDVNVGGVVGESNGSTITNAYNTGAVSGYSDVGGVVGKNTNSSTITSVYNTGTVTGENSFIGGVIGSNEGGTITNAYNTGTVDGYSKGDTFYVGGVVGQNVEGTITNVYNTGGVDGVNNVGGVVGENLGGTISNALWANDLSYTPAGGYMPTQAVGNQSDTATVKGTNLAEMKKAATYDSWKDASSNKIVATTGNAGTAWRIYDGHTTPLLTSLFKGVITVTGLTVEYNGQNHTADISQLTFVPTLSDTSHIFLADSVGRNVGTYGSLYSDQQGYDLVNDKTLTITPIALTATLTGNNVFTKEYDGDATVDQTLTLGSTYTLDKVVSGDTVSIATNTTGSYNNKNAGNGKTISYTGIALTGADAGNYTIADTLSADVGKITQKDLTAALIDTSSISKTYDGTDKVTTALTKGTNYQFTGMVDGDALNLTGTGKYTDKNAGNDKTVSFTDLVLTGDDAGNYNLKTETLSGNVGKINQKTIAAELKSGSIFAKEYDGTDVVTTALVKYTNYVLPNMISGDDLSLDTTKISGTYTAGKDVGNNLSVIFTGLKLTGKDADNYDLLDFSMGDNYGKITPKALTATLTGDNVFTKVYDGTTAVSQALTQGTNYTLDGIVADSDKVLLSAGSGAYNDKNAGDNKIITFSGLTLTGTGAGNYTIASTLSGAVGQITRKTITGTLTSGYSFDKVYDGTTTASLGNGYTLSGVVAGDKVPLTAAKGFYDSSAVGNRTVTFSGFSINDGNYLLSMADSLSGTGKITSGSQDHNYNDAISSFFGADHKDGYTIFGGNTEDYIPRAVSQNNGQSYKVGVTQVTQTWYNGPATITIINGGITLPKDILLGSTYDTRTVVIKGSNSYEI